MSKYAEALELTAIEARSAHRARNPVFAAQILVTRADDDGLVARDDDPVVPDSDVTEAIDAISREGWNFHAAAPIGRDGLVLSVLFTRRA